MRRWLRLTATSVAALALAACGGASGQGPLTLSWQFADGRGCPESGVVAVRVLVDDNRLDSPLCEAGLAPAAITLPAVARSGTLSLVGLSAQSTALYRGDTALDVTLAPRTVTLYAVAAR
jgi:hypothetical protein